MLGLWAAQMTSSTGSWTRIPLTDGHYGVSFINKVANSTQVREKGLKCVIVGYGPKQSYRVLDLEVFRRPAGRR